MNKTLLLILCDFLLLTLLSLVNWEEEKSEASRQASTDTTEESVSSGSSGPMRSTPSTRYRTSARDPVACT